MPEISPELEERLFRMDQQMFASGMRPFSPQELQAVAMKLMNRQGARQGQFQGGFSSGLLRPQTPVSMSQGPVSQQGGFGLSQAIPQQGQPIQAGGMMPQDGGLVPGMAPQTQSTGNPGGF